MSNDDRSLASVLWLVAGGAAGYAVARFVVGPGHAPIRQMPPAESRRALGAGPQPVDPYTPVFHPYAGPSGDMRPIDPYGDIPPSSASITPTSTASVSSIAEDPIPKQPAAPTVVTSGPITSPSQLENQPPESALVKPVLPSAGFATKPRVRRFDAVFARYRGEIPIEYVRALVERESDGQSAARSKSAVGLMQIVPIVLADYNKRHGTQYRSEHLTDPAINVAIGCELLRLIVASYRKYHPRIPALQADWNNSRFVELLTFGWNAGYSEAGGLGRVANYLEQLGARDIDVDLVAAHAKLAGATKHLSNPKKLAWSKGVAALYQRERLARASFVAA